MRRLARNMKPSKWAMRDSKQPDISREKPHISPQGAEKSAESRGDRFAAAVAAVMALPLSDTEKAEAVRRLLDTP